MSLIGQNNGSIRELIRQARRRFFLNVALAQAALAGSVGMAGAVLLLVFGAQVLDWRWLALLAILTFPLAYFRTARRVPSPYRVAQIVDARLALRDSISTALYFSEHPEPGRGSESMRLAQIDESERMGSQVDPKTAVPLTRPRMLSVLGSLFMLAAILFGLRYGVQHTMDLRRPLSRILIDAFGGGGPKQRADLKKARRFPMEIWNQMAQDDSTGSDGQLKEGEDLNAPETPESTAEQGEQANAGSDPSASDAEKESDDATASGENAGEESGEGTPSSGKDGDPSGKQGENPDGKQSANSPENASLASKIKDAMSSLMSSLRGKDSSPTPGKSGGEPKSQQAKSGQKGSSKGEKKSGDQGSNSEDGQQADAESGQPGEGKGSGQSSAGQPGGEGSSGAGNQDGSKDTKLAQQLAAMGQISEIIGKRSANVTGEVTVEVTSSKQPGRTASADGKAAHGEATGEINRDEVPAAFQEYVQQYFEQVRKPAQGTGKGSPPPSQ